MWQVMIKDKITPQIKNRLLEEIRISKANGRERGFFLCKDDKEIIPSRTCEGDECSLVVEDPSIICPKGLIGNIHIEPYVSATKRDYQKKRIIIPSDDVLKLNIEKKLRKKHEEKDLGELSPVSPSYLNTLNILLLKCFKNIDTFTCVTSDLDENKMECWTPKKDIRKGQCVRSLYEQKKVLREKERLFPKKWITSLFTKEVIQL